MKLRAGIVIPAFNAEPWIATAINSVLGQTDIDWRLVVVDDGSEDTTSGVVATFSDPRIRLVRQPNSGASAARNRGAQELAREDVDAILYLDADDYLASDALSRLGMALERSPSAIAAVGSHVFTDTGFGHRPLSGDLLADLLEYCPFGNAGSVLVRRGATEKAGGFRTELRFGEDWEFMVRIALLGPFAGADDGAPVLFINTHPTGLFQSAATDPAMHAACTNVIFSNPALTARFGRKGLAKARRRTEANNSWAIGRVLVRRGEIREGKAWLRHSLLRAPTAKRAAILAAIYLNKVLPRRWLGPFQAYGTALPARTYRLT